MVLGFVKYLDRQRLGRKYSVTMSVDKVVTEWSVRCPILDVQHMLIEGQSDGSLALPYISYVRTGRRTNVASHAVNHSSRSTLSFDPRDRLHFRNKNTA